MNTGVDLLGNAIKLAIGEKVYPNDLIPTSNKYICQRYIFPKSGRIKEINGLNDLDKNLSIKYFNFHVKPGEIIHKPTAHPARVGMLIAGGSSRNDARINATRAIKSVSIAYQ